MPLSFVCRVSELCVTQKVAMRKTRFLNESCLRTDTAHWEAPAPPGPPQVVSVLGASSGGLMARAQPTRRDGCTFNPRKFQGGMAAHSTQNSFSLPKRRSASGKTLIWRECNVWLNWILHEIFLAILHAIFKHLSLWVITRFALIYTDRCRFNDLAVAEVAWWLSHWWNFDTTNQILHFWIN